MRTMLATTFLLASLLTMPLSGTPVLAQNADNAQGGVKSVPPESLNLGPDNPSPVTGELVPLPGPPPEGQADKIKLPDCKPPNCGVPQIMTE